MKTRLSIKLCIILLISAVIIAVLACQLIFSVFFSTQYYTLVRQNEIKNLFYYIKSVYTDDIDALFSDINIRGYDYNIIIFNEQGVAASNRLALARTTEFFEPRTEQAYFGISNYFANFSENPEAEVNAMIMGDNISKNITLSGKFNYGTSERYVLIQMPVQSIEESVSIISGANAVISVFVLIIGVAGAVIFSSRFSKPIRHIQSVAHSVSEMDFSGKANENLSINELNNLASSINVMSDRLSGLIADLREKNEKLSQDIDYQKKLDLMRRTFIANVSHELKTPLCLLQLYCENLKNSSLEIDRGYYLDTIVNEVENMDIMVKSMLKLSLVENGLTEMNFVDINLSEFTERLARKMFPFLKGIIYNIEIESGLYINGDMQYLEQVFKNYITNAAAHTEENGKILVSLRKNADNVRFSVYNEGNAIPEEDLTQIWESFYKTDKSRVRQNGEIHAGLGLYIVKTIIEAHSGTYGVFNTETGVEFWVELKTVSEPYQQ